MILLISGVIIFLVIGIRLRNEKKKRIEEKKIEMSMKVYQNKKEEFLKDLSLENKR